LYGANERIQAALFGTSTREYLYLHKRDIAMKLLRRHTTPSQSAPDVAERPYLLLPRSNRAANGTPSTQADLVRRFADLGRSHHKRVVFLAFESPNAPKVPIAEIAANAPNAEVVIVRVPTTLTLDKEHLTVQGCRLVAALLAQYDAQHANGASAP
jgi:hypothetical protein